MLNGNIEKVKDGQKFSKNNISTQSFGKLLSHLIIGTSVFASSALYAAEQANRVSEGNYQTPSHKFSNNEVYDSAQQTFKQVNGKNYYGVLGNSVNGVTLNVSNPKDTTQAQAAKLQILTPDFSANEVIKVKGKHAASNANKELREITILPFLMAGLSNNGNVSNNRLNVKDAELSSVVFLKPSTMQAEGSKDPEAIQQNQEDGYLFIVAAGLSKKGNATSNTLELQKGSYVNMGVQNTYNTPLNGAPYIVGGVAVRGEAAGNKVVANSGAKIDFHATPYGMSQNNEFVIDERMTHLIGGLSYNGSAKDNQVHLNGAEFIVHGSKGGYSTYSATHIAGAFADGDDGRNYNVTNNSLIIDSFLLNLRVDGRLPYLYDAVLFGEFFGGKTVKGNAHSNKIVLKKVPSIARINSEVKVQGAYEFFAGYTAEGKANNNSLEVSLDSPLMVSATYLRQNIFGFYGAFATEGANNNTVKIRNNLTAIDGTENMFDRVKIVAARTIAGEANNNVIDFRDSQVSLPLFVYTTQYETYEGSLHSAETANNNSITLNNVFGRKDIRAGVEAMSVEKNSIVFHDVEAQSSGAGQDKESSAFIKGAHIAKHNTIKLSNYWATAQLNLYGVYGEIEAHDNAVVLNNVNFSKDTSNSGLVIVGGVGSKTFDNVVSIEDIGIGEYNPNEDYVYIAASALPVQEGEVESYNNTLYIGGDVELNRNTILSALSGSVLRLANWNTSNISAVTLPAPSLENLSKDNHLILERHLHAKVVNNFEHYSFIYNKTNKAVSFAVSLEVPVNLSKNTKISLLTKAGDQLARGTKIPLITSMNGFADINGNVLSSARVTELLKEIERNTNSFNYNKIPQLEKAKFNKPSIKLSLGDEGRTIYAEI